MADSKTHRLAFALSVLLSPLLFIEGLGSFRTRSLDALWNLGHLGLFFALTIGVLGLIRARGQVTRGDAGLVVVATLVVAVAIELLQGFVGRSQSVEDVLLSVGGSVLALAWQGDFRGRRLVLAALVVACGLPTALALWDEWRAQRDFPVLAEFRSGLELSRFRFTGKQRLVQSDSGGVELEPDPEGRLAWQLVYFAPDWSRFKRVEMRYALRADSLTLTCVLNDLQHERALPHEDADHFAQKFTLHGGAQTVEIDLASAEASLAGRRMNMKEIASLRCSGKASAAGTALVINAITLRD